MATYAQRHNSSVVRTFSAGDIVEFPRKYYSHYGIYAGNSKVIHLTGDNDGIGDGASANSFFSLDGREFDKAYVREDDFFDVAGDSVARKDNKDHKVSPVAYGWEIVARARSKLGSIGYNVLWKNCEHFASWCRYGIHWSEQVDRGIQVGGLVGGAVLLGAAFRWWWKKEKTEEEG